MSAMPFEPSDRDGSDWEKQGAVWICQISPSSVEIGKGSVS
jgi:hypothetical protein